MAVEQLNFQGINRAASDFSNGGACEEMINLRPTGTGLVPVKPFSVKMHGVAYDKLYIHKAGAVTNYIAVKLNNGTLYIYRVSEEGIELSTLATVDVTGNTNFSVDHVHFAYTGNIVLFSIADKEDGFYRNISFLWDSTEYKEQNADTPSLDISFKENGSVETIRSSVVIETTILAPLKQIRRELIECANTAINEVQESNKAYCFGPFIMAIAFKTDDGLVFGTREWRIYNPIPDFVNQSNELVYTPTEWAQADMPIKRATNWEKVGDVAFPGDDYIFDIGRRGQQAVVSGKRAPSVRISLSAGQSFDINKSIIKSIEVYTSVPSIHINPELIPMESLGGAPFESGDVTEDWYFIPLNKFNEMELDNKLLYLQKSIQIAELIDRETPYEVELEFGGNIQTTNKTLEVDAGPTTRYGKLLSYNSRFHFFDSVAKIDVGMPEFLFGDTDGSTTSTAVFVTYNDGREDITAYVGSELLPVASNGTALVVIARHSKVKKVVTQYYGEDRYYWAEYPMDESKRYNYSIYVSNESKSVSDARVPIYDPSQHPSTIIKKEPEAINVTEQYNPFVFKVEHSYLAPGAVLDVQPQMVAVKDVTYGEYPLNVFTNRGLYALLQGNGVVLYGNFKSISNLITTANAIPTEMGTFFLAADGMWLVAGDTVVLVSDALSRGPHKFVREAPGYYDICHDTYDVTRYVSAVSFEEFTKETAFSSAARLVYNRYRDELMVCNPDYDYCYVLSLKYRQWFKLSETYSQDAVGEIAFSGMSVRGHVVSEDSPAPYHTITVSFTIGGNTFTCDHYVADRERNARAVADALTSDCREAFAGTVLSEISFVAALDASSKFHLSAILPKTIDDPQSVTASLFKIVNRAEETIFEGSFLFAVGRNVVSFEDEDELAHSILVHLQTRPFSIGYQYIHIHRIVAMIRARLASGHLIVNALYGSDDLQNWTLISYASRQNAQISQIRTPSAARSWRYYTVCIGGHVHWDTDLGTVLFDYQPVVRRIG